MKVSGSSSKTTGRYFSFPAQPSECGGRDPAVVVGEFGPEFRPGLRAQPAIAFVFGDELRLVQELIALEHADRVPGPAAAEIHGDAPLARSVFAGPALERGGKRLGEGGRRTAAAVLPGKNVVIVEPGRPGRRLRFLDEAQVPDRQVPRIAGIPAAIAVPEGIKLLDIADREAGLRGDPAPQAQIERGIDFRVRGPEGRAGMPSPGWVVVKIRGSPAVTATMTASRLRDRRRGMRLFCP